MNWSGVPNLNERDDDELEEPDIANPHATLHIPPSLKKKLDDESSSWTAWPSLGAANFSMKRRSRKRSDKNGVSISRRAGRRPRGATRGRFCLVTSHISPLCHITRSEGPRGLFRM